MFLSVVTFVIVGPMIVIAGIVALVREIVRVCKGDDINNRVDDSKYNVRYETPKEEEERINEWGYDDERWGKL